MTTATTQTVKDQLHALVDLLPEDEALDDLGYLRWVLSEEDELTEEEWGEVHRGEEEIARGDYVTLEDLKRQLAG